MTNIRAAIIVIVVLNLLIIAAINWNCNTSPPPVEQIDPTIPEVEIVPPLTDPPVSRSPSFTSVATFQPVQEQSVYGDVLSHSAERAFGNKYGRATNVHETAHGIHSYLRNHYSGSGHNFNGFYCLGGKAVLIEEPNIRKRRVAEFVPQSLRSYRFQTYIVGQMAWDEIPLYILDEWTAYTLSGMANVEDVANGVYSGGWTDGVSGCLEFSIYSVALCMAVKEHDPSYWNSNQQFRRFVILMLRQAREAYMIGHVMDEFKWDKQDQLLHAFLTNEECKPMREFIRTHLDEVWLEFSPVALETLEYEEYQRGDKPVEIHQLILP